jgi:hypothetical protein
METPEEYAARQARLDARYPRRHVVSTLQEWTCFAANIDGDPVDIGICCSYTNFGASEVARKRVKSMTILQRRWLRLSKRAHTWVEVRLTAFD